MSQTKRHLLAFRVGCHSAAAAFRREESAVGWRCGAAGKKQIPPLQGRNDKALGRAQERLVAEYAERLRTLRSLSYKNAAAFAGSRVECISEFLPFVDSVIAVRLCPPHLRVHVGNGLVVG
jgi:hypothetical protein